VSIHNPNMLAGLKKRIKRITGETSERPAKIRAAEIVNELFGNSENVESPACESPAVNSKITTISDMIDKYHIWYLENIKVHSPEKQKKMKSDVMSVLGHLKRHIGGENVKNLDLNLINEYIIKRRADVKENGAPYADSTIEHEIGILKAASNVLSNGLKATVRINMGGKHISLKKVDREVLLTDQEFDAMLQKFREYDFKHNNKSNYAFFLEMIMFTSVRWGQMKLLEYSDIDYNGRYLKFPAWKTKHLKTGTHDVKVSKSILIKLKKCLETNDNIDNNLCDCSKSKNCKIKDSSWVFINKHKRCEPFKKDMFYILWNQFCDELGLTEFDKFKKSEKQSTILPHDIRRTRIVKMIKRGIDRSYIMAQSGHQSQEIFNKYNVVQDDVMTKHIDEQDALDDKERAREVKNDADFDQDYNDEMETIWDSRK
jgi:integrase